MKLIHSILFVITIALSASTLTLAHDEGHGPRLVDTGNYGGILSAVVDGKDINLGARASLVYKAELTRSGDNTIRVYLYDKDMKPLALESFNLSAKGLLMATKNGKEISLPFELKKQGSHFLAKLPSIPAKPYNIDIRYQVKERELFSAFDNLD